MKEFIVDDKYQGKKLFNFIHNILPGLKNNEIFKLIRKKVITVNNKKETPDYIIKTNDIIKIFLALKHFEKKGKKNKFFSIKNNINIIFEDKDLLVINKPKGLVCHPDKNNYKNNLYEMVRSYLYNKGEYQTNNVFTPAPCHRLDQNTSGLLVFAKNHLTLKKITEQFRLKKAIKTYLALVYGKIDKTALLTSIVETKEIRVVQIKNFKTMEVIPDKNEFLINNPMISATLIKPIKKSKYYSFLEIELWTGKKHQIRAHLQKFNHPLLGDKKYFTKESTNISLKNNIKSYFLHAYKLKIDDYPEWTCEIPLDFKKTIDLLFT